MMDRFWHGVRLLKSKPYAEEYYYHIPKEFLP